MRDPAHRFDAEAFALTERACNGGGPPACTMLGELIIDGRGAPRDEARSAELYRRGCDAGDGRGCQLLAQRYGAG